MRKPEGFKNLIYKLAHQFKSSFPEKEFEDLVQEGWEVFARLCKTEKTQPLSCPFHTALGIQIKQSWLNELKAKSAKKRGNNQPSVSLETGLEQDDDPSSVEPSLSYDPTNRLDRYLDLSEELKTVVHLLQDSPKELIQLSKTFDLKTSIILFLKTFYHWEDLKINKLRTELK